MAPPGPVDDVLDHLRSLHGHGDLHRPPHLLVRNSGGPHALEGQRADVWGGTGGAFGLPPHLLPLFTRFPFYYEVKMAFVIWLLSPYTRGASLLYRRFLHPTLARKEKVQIPEVLGLLPARPGGIQPLLSWVGDALGRWHCPGR